MAESGVPTLWAMATMFAVPPIQLPDSAANPFQASGGRNPLNMSSAMGAPTMIPTVPAVTMKSAFGPRRATLFRSMDTMSMRSAKGRRYRVVQSYAGEDDGVMPAVVARMGRK